MFLSRRKKAARLSLEALEDRVLLASSLLYQAVSDTALTMRVDRDELQIVPTASPATVLASAVPRGSVCEGIGCVE